MEDAFAVYGAGEAAGDGFADQEFGGGAGEFSGFDDRTREVEVFVEELDGGAALFGVHHTLQDPLAPIVSPYRRVPQLYGALFSPGVAGRLDVALPAEYVRFTHSSLVDGTRVSLNPSVSLPISAFSPMTVLNLFSPS